MGAEGSPSKGILALFVPTLACIYVRAVKLRAVQCGAVKLRATIYVVCSRFIDCGAYIYLVLLCPPYYVERD